jgi:hypothetical protein
MMNDESSLSDSDRLELLRALLRQIVYSEFLTTYLRSCILRLQLVSFQ